MIWSTVVPIKKPTQEMMAHMHVDMLHSVFSAATVYEHLGGYRMTEAIKNQAAKYLYSLLDIKPKH